MTESLKSLIEALRDELKNYGEMLVLLDDQQSHLKNRDATEVSRSISEVRIQGEALLKAREFREEAFYAVAQDWGQLDGARFADIIPLAPLDYRPLLSALVQENDELLFLVRQRAQQNHQILKRSVQLMHQVLLALCPLRSEVTDEPVPFSETVAIPA